MWKMSKAVRTPNRYGTDMRARRRDDKITSAVGECITRPMTEDERARLESLPKPEPKERIIGMNIMVDKAMKRKGYSG